MPDFKKPFRTVLSDNTKALEQLALQHGVTETGQKHIDEMRAEVDGRNERAEKRSALIAATKEAAKAADTGKSEIEIQREIIRYLLDHPAVVMVERINSGAVYNGDDTHDKGFIRFHYLMLPKRFRDIRMRVTDLSVTLVGARRMVIEVKKEGWTKPENVREREQAAYLAHVRDAGGIGIFATCVGDVEAVLENSA